MSRAALSCTTPTLLRMAPMQPAPFGPEFDKEFPSQHARKHSKALESSFMSLLQLLVHSGRQKRQFNLLGQPLLPGYSGSGVLRHHIVPGMKCLSPSMPHRASELLKRALTTAPATRPGTNAKEELWCRTQGAQAKCCSQILAR